MPALAVPETVDLKAVAVGRQEDGEPWLLRVLGTHLLIAGATGAGKGSVLWSLIRGLGLEIRDGRVAVWAIDPKGGMELAPGRALFARFCGGEFEAMADLLDDAVEVMKDRARRLAGVTRLHEPTVAEPLILVVVDEVATLTAYQTDRELRKRISHALGLLLTQGRAVAVCVVAALQDPRKEVLAFRNLFPAKVGLRLDDPTQVALQVPRPLIGGSELHVDARLDGGAHERRAAALQMHREPVGDLARGPADVMSGVLVGRVEVQDVDGALDVVPEAELLLRTGRHDALPGSKDRGAPGHPAVMSHAAAPCRVRPRRTLIARQRSRPGLSGAARQGRANASPGSGALDSPERRS